MQFQFFAPCRQLAPFVKHYFSFRSDSDQMYADTVYPSGEMEAIFNLGDGSWAYEVNGRMEKTPQTELWGQVTGPLSIRSYGRHAMLGIRFHPYAAACFIPDNLAIFNNQVTDLKDVLGAGVASLHGRLLETPTVEAQVQLTERFLCGILNRNPVPDSRLRQVTSILCGIEKLPGEKRIQEVAEQHGLSLRYMQRLLLQHTGLSPKAFGRISRFQKSLRLLAAPHVSLTEVAYQSGYFDQSHFIRDFKAFTGVTPLSYLQNLSPMNALLTK